MPTSRTALCPDQDTVQVNLGQKPSLPMSCERAASEWAWGDSLAHSQLLSAGTAQWKSEMPPGFPPVFVFLCPFTLLFSDLLWPFSFFPSPPSFVVFHALLSCLPTGQKLVSPISLVPTLLASSDPGRSLMVKYSTVLSGNDSPSQHFVSDE